MLHCPVDKATVKAAKSWIIETAISLKSCKCPVCGQTVKLYPRNLSSALARFLIDIYKLTIDRPAHSRWVNVSQEMIDRTEHHVSRDYAKLRFWGLLEANATQNGEWRITEAGIAFVEGRSVTPQKAYVYNNYCVRLSSTMTDIKGALGKKFSLHDLLEPKEVV